MKRFLMLSALVWGGLLVGAGGVRAQVYLGPEAGFSTDYDFGVGGRIQTSLNTSIPLDFQGSFDVFFPDGPREYWEINGNVWYVFDIESIPEGALYAGAGLNIGRKSGESSTASTDLGLNLGGGYRFKRTGTQPFLEAKFTIGGSEHFVIGGGVLFDLF